MADTQLPRLSPGELELMKVLWKRERSSAREVHQALPEALGWAYSTTRTTLERMVHKGVVVKRQFHGIHLYAAGISRPAGLARLVRDFAHNVLGSPPAPVLSLFADCGSLSEDELAELGELLRSDKAGERP